MYNVKLKILEETKANCIKPNKKLRECLDNKKQTKDVKITNRDLPFS